MSSTPVSEVTILVAGADVVFRQRMAKALARAGFAVVQARDARQTLAICEVCPPKLAVLDSDLPHLDGAAVARELRQRSTTCELPIILVTEPGETEQELADPSSHAPWTLAVSKRTKLRQLVAEISTRVGVGQATAAHEAKLEALRQRFVGEAHGLLDDLRTRLHDEGPCDVPALAKEVRAVAHRMAGSAPMFGCDGLGDLSRQVESAIDEWNAGPGSPAERELVYLREKVDEAMTLLRTAAERSTVPARRNPAAGPGTSASGSAGRPRVEHNGERRILLLHDDPELAATLTNVAARRGVRVETFDSAAAALARLPEHSFDCVIAGGAEVRADGFAVVGRIRALCPRVPLIALSSHDSTTVRVAATRAGVDRLVDVRTDPVRLFEVCSQAFASNESQGGRILVVDDDPSVLALIETVLTDNGYEAATLDDPSRLFEVLAGFEPDLLLCDINMPAFNGVELTGSLRASERWHGLPIVIMTRYSDIQSRANAFHAGADDFVTKPIVMEELIIRISARLERDAMQRAVLERDPATGALNRRTFLAKASALWTGSELAETGATLALVELENIPAFIQTHGLAAGDEALVAVIERLSEAFRASSPLIGRISGEAIAVVVTGVEADEAVERLQASVTGLERDKRLSPDGRRQDAIGVRIAVAACDAAEPLTELLDRAIVTGCRPVRVTVTRIPKNSDVHLGRAFVVEDDPILREMLTYSLERAGFECAAFDNGADALEAMLDADTGESAPVVLLDIDLPRMDGLSVLARIEQERPGRFQTVLMTAHGTERDRLRGLRSNAADYVCKPVSVAVMVEKAVRLARH